MITKKYTITSDLLDEIINYIEEMEHTLDGEWGSSRSIEELIRDNSMTELYNKLIILKNGC